MDAFKSAVTNYFSLPHWHYLSLSSTVYLIFVTFNSTAFFLCVCFESFTSHSQWWETFVNYNINKINHLPAARDLRILLRFYQHPMWFMVYCLNMHSETSSYWALFSINMFEIHVHIWPGVMISPKWFLKKLHNKKGGTLGFMVLRN